MSDLPKAVVRGIVFDEDGATIEYCIPAQDLRANGVVFNHVLHVPRGDQYDDEIDAATESVIALLEDVLEDLPYMQPSRPKPADDDDDDDDVDDVEHGD